MHYESGEEVRLGDRVFGKPYNTEHAVCGEVVGLVPEEESCNLRVAFAAVRQANASAVPPEPRMALNISGIFIRGIWLGAGSKSEPSVHVWPCVDYGDTKGFKLLGRGPDDSAVVPA